AGEAAVEHAATGGPGAEEGAAVAPDAGLHRPGSDGERVAVADGYHDADDVSAGPDVGGDTEADHAAAPTAAVPIPPDGGPARTATSGSRPRRAGGGSARRPERRAGGRRRRRGAGDGRAGSGGGDGRRRTTTADR